MQRAQERQECQELTEEEAIDEVAACARNLFTAVSGQQARALAAVVLGDLRARGIRLVRRGSGAG